MSKWSVLLVSANSTSPVDIQGPSENGEHELTRYVTRIAWSHSINAPYSSADISVLIPARDTSVLFRLGYNNTQGVFIQHASAFIAVYEDSMLRFYGAIQSVGNEVKADGKTGARVTVPIKIKASTWITPLMRGFRVSAAAGLEVAGFLVSTENWGKVTSQVLDSASSDGITASLARMWSYYPQSLVGGSVLSGPDYGSLRLSNGDPSLVQIPVQGRNLSQLQPPAMKTTLWGIITATCQASPLVELFPVFVYDIRKRVSGFYIVHRLRPPAPSMMGDEGVRFLGEFLGDFSLYFNHPSFYPSKDSVGTPSTVSPVISYSLTYSDDRRNYIEVNSPYTGTGQLAGVSCDPLYSEEDIKAYGLMEFSPDYPYIRAAGEESIREEMNELVRHTALVYGFSHRYGNGQVTTKFVAGSTIAHGDWIRWRAHGSETLYYEAYVTQISHTLTVNKEGVLEGTSVYTVERASPR